MQTIDTLIAQLPEISTDARYWFVRTDSGRLYGAFISSQSIAMGYEKISIKEIKALPIVDTYQKLRDIVGKHYPNKRSSGIAAAQLLTFCRDIKKGDFVLIPNQGTEKIAIGIIEDGKVYEEVLKGADYDYPEYEKRLKVKWLGAFQRQEINPNVWRILHTHQTIVEATAYSPWIDSLLYDFYKKGDEYHYLLRIGKREHINGRILFESCLELFEIGDAFATREQYSENSAEIDVKINLNSPGDIELIASTAKILGIIALSVIMLNGGGLKFRVQRFGIDLDINTDGFIKKFNKFLNDRSNRRIKESLNEKLQHLNVNDSAQVESMIKTLNGKSDE